MTQPTCESLGIKFSGGDAAEAIARVNEYLRAFQGDGKCPCGRSLGGFLGSFTWGIVHGEGFCARCQWPARGFHTIDLRDLGELRLSLPLPYAPELVSARAEAQP